jgi:hypothetical protein
MSNPILFLSSSIFTINIMYYYTHNNFYYFNLFLGITSILNHGTFSKTFQILDRIYVPIYIMYMTNYIYNACYQDLIKLLIYFNIISGIFCVSYSMYLRKQYLKEKLITPIHLFSHLILIIITNLLIWLDKSCAL